MKTNTTIIAARKPKSQLVASIPLNSKAIMSQIGIVLTTIDAGQ
jgi:hypothetical protein